MATNSIDKGLYAAPLGIEEDMDMAPIEIEIEDPEGVRIAMGGIEIELEPGKKETDEDINDIINMAENQMYMQKIVDKNNTSNDSMIKSGEDFYRTGGMTDASKEKMKKLLEFLSEP